MKKIVLLFLSLVGINNFSQAQSAINFDGTNDFVRSLNNVAHGSSFTYEALVNISTASDWEGIITTQTAGSWVQMSVNNAGALRVEMTDGSSSKWYDGTTTLIGAQHHVAITYDGTNLLLYVDGNVETVSMNVNGAVSNLSINAKIFVGAERDLNYYMHGTVDEARIWNITRSQTEIQKTMGCSVAGNATGLLLYYDFNDGVANDDNTAIARTQDLTANDNDGILFNLNKNGTFSNYVTNLTLTGPTVSLNESSILIPSGIQDTLIATVTGGTAPYAYSWSPGTHADNDTAYFSSNTPGVQNWNVMLTDDNGCASRASASAMTTFESSLDFDGTDDYIDAGVVQDFNGASAITVEAWINTNSTANLQTIAGNYGSGDMQFLLRLDNMQPVFWVSSGGGFFYNATGTTTIPMNTWVHVAGTWDGTTIKIYYNGVLDASTTYSGAFPTSIYPLRVGASITNEVFSGQIDEVNIWNTARTSTQILNTMACPIDDNATGLVIHYNFNEGLAGGNNTVLTTVFDQSANAYDATLMNFALTGTTSNYAGGVTTISSSMPMVNVIASSMSICAGVSDTLIATATGGSSPYTYMWAPGTHADNDTAFFSSNNPGLKNWRVIVKDQNGCVSMEDTVKVTVNALPTVTATSDATNDAVCEGSDITLMGGGADSYTWDNGAADGSAFALNDTTTYTVTGTDLNGCVNTATITVYTLPLPQVSNITGDVEVCGETSQDFELTSGLASYAWSYSDDLTNWILIDGSYGESNFNTNIMTIDSSESYGWDDFYVAAEVTGSNGCSVISEASYITVNSLPTVTATSDATNNTVCEGSDITLMGGGADSYVWDNSVSDNTAFALTDTMTYTVTGTDVNGCENTESITVYTLPLPAVTATSDAVNDVVCTGNPVTLTASGTATSYSWDNGVTDGSAFVPADTTTYTVTGEDANGCTNTTTITVYVDLCTGLANNSAASLSVYPNPTTGNVTITTSGTVANSIEVFDVVGNFVANVLVTSETTNINLSTYADGVYVVKVRSNNTTQNIRIVKAN